MKTNRRSLIKKLSLTLSGLFGAGVATAAAKTDVSNEKILTGEVVLDQDVPLFSSAIVHNGLVYIAGKGAHYAGDIKAHTKTVLDDMQKELEKAGSSMEHVLKCNVYLNTLDDYKAMNEVFRGRFGKVPPVRTTIAAQGGIPGDSLVEIDCIAKLK
jgi:enamine deaminase RidA (YjgF/YER057c/UK114 family)